MGLGLLFYRYVSLHTQVTRRKKNEKKKFRHDVIARHCAVTVNLCMQLRVSRGDQTTHSEGDGFTIPPGPSAMQKTATPNGARTSLDAERFCSAAVPCTHTRIDQAHC